MSAPVRMIVIAVAAVLMIVAMSFVVTHWRWPFAWSLLDADF